MTEVVPTVFITDTRHDYIMLLRPQPWFGRQQVFFPLKSIFSFPPLSPIRSFQRSWSGRLGWVKGGGKRERGREMDKERRSRRHGKEERNWEKQSCYRFSQPTGIAPVAMLLWKKKSSSANHLCLELLSAPVTHPVCVTNSNKHPNLITQLPLNPTVLKGNQEFIPNRAAVGFLSLLCLFSLVSFIYG